MIVDVSARADSVQQSVQDLLRAIGGGLLVGLPLLFTMEMWIHSSSSDHVRSRRNPETAL